MIVEMRGLLSLILKFYITPFLEKCFWASDQPPCGIRQCCGDTPLESHPQQGNKALGVASDLCLGNSFHSHPPIETLIYSRLDMLMFDHFCFCFSGTHGNFIGMLGRYQY